MIITAWDGGRCPHHFAADLQSKGSGLALQQRAGIGLPAIWGNLTQQMYLGSDEFVEEMKEKLNAPFTGVDMQEVPRMLRRPTTKSLEWYKAQYEQRDSGMVATYRSGEYTMKEIADWFGVHSTTVSRALKKAENV